MYVDRWYQTESVDAIAPFYQRQIIGNPLIGLPTGTGKSLVSARINQMIARHFPWHRGLNLTHVKELIDQNSKKLIQVWPDAPIGILSAGMGRKEATQPIIFGGVQTAVNHLEQLGHRDYVLIDEAHLVGTKESAIYLRILNHLKAINPNLITMGLTATLYRMKMGELTEGGIFTHTAYDLTNVTGFNRLLSEGFIAPLIPQPTEATVDGEGVEKSGGEYNLAKLQAKVDKQEITAACVDEMLLKAWDRNCWMIFASGVEHAEHIAQELNSRGISAAAVHSKKKGCDEIIADFKAGRIRAIVNFNKLTTGFDHPPIDFIAMMRATMSPGLWVQMLGRGTRPYDGRYANQYIVGFEYIKVNCLVLDFARNAARLGPINDPVKPRKPGEKGGDAPIKLCEVKIGTKKCNTYNHASARYCCLCGSEFPFNGAAIFAQSGNVEVMRVEEPQDIRYLDVSHVLYSKINKNGVPPMMRVSYICGIAKFDEIVCLEHTTRAVYFAREWWKQTHGDVPPSTDAGLQIAHSGQLRTPKKLKVWVNNKPYPTVLEREY